MIPNSHENSSNTEPRDNYTAPHDDNAEQAVMGGLMMFPEQAGEVLPQLAVDDFYAWQGRAILPVYQKIHTAARAIVNAEVEHQLRAQNANWPELEKWLADGCDSCVIEAMLPANLRVVKKLSAERRLHSATHRLHRATVDNQTPESIQQCLAEVNRLLGDRAAPAAVAKRSPRYAPMPLDCLPDAMREYVDAVASALPCAAETVVLPLLAALGAAVGNSRRISLKSSWTEPAVIWACTVLPSGKLKSPAHDAGIKFLTGRQRKLIAEFKRAMRQYESDKIAWEDSRGRAKKSKLPAEMLPPPEPPICHRYTTSDATIEALASLLEENERGLLLERDELSGWIGGFDKYSNGSGEMPAMLSTHRAGSLTVDRKTGKRITHVPHAHVSICGTIQPATLTRCLTPDFFDSGLTARILLALPPSPPKRWNDAIIPHAVDAAMDDLFGRLLALELATLTDDDGEEYTEPVALPLSPDAKLHWIGFYDAHAEEQENLGSDRESSAWSKLEGYAARFALIFTLCRDSAAVEIDSQSMADAIQLTRWFGHETRRVYAMLAGQETDNPQAELASMIQARFGGRITPRELKRASRKFQPTEKAEAALQELAKSGYGRWEMNVNPDGGRPVQVFVLGAVAMLPVATTPENPERHEVLASGYAATAPQMQSAQPPDYDSVPDWLNELNADGEAARQAESEASDGL